MFYNCLLIFFFFKQKTAYEIVDCDWSSDVCSSDLRFGQQGVSGAGKSPKTASEKARRKSFKARHAKNISKEIGRASCRERV